MAGSDGFGRGRGQAQQPLDTLGRPKQVTLTIAADEQTNSIFGTATGEMQQDIEKIVKEMEDMAKNSTKVITLVPTPGIDPSLVQDVLDAIQGRTPTSQQGGMGFGGFGGGRGGFGGGRGGVGGFGMSPFGGTVGGRFGGGGTRGGFGTPGGGRFGGGTRRRRHSWRVQRRHPRRRFAWRRLTRRRIA